MIASGEASEEQKRLYKRIKNTEKGILQYNHLSYDEGGNASIAGVYLQRLDDLSSEIERDYRFLLK